MVRTIADCMILYQQDQNAHNPLLAKLPSPNHGNNIKVTHFHEYLYIDRRVFPR